MTETTYLGRRLSELTREELIEAIERAAREIQVMRESQSSERATWKALITAARQ